MSQNSFSIRIRKVSPIDTDHSCFFSNRLFQKELKKEEETPLVNFIQLLASTFTTSNKILMGGCESQKKMSECNDFSRSQFTESRKPTDQCGWCSKGTDQLCVSCDSVRAREVEGYTCSPDTNACYYPTSAESRGADVTPKEETKKEEPPKPDELKPCETAPNGEPCGAHDSSTTSFGNLRKNHEEILTNTKRESDPSLPSRISDGPLATDKSEGKPESPKPDDPVTPDERVRKEQNDFHEAIRYGSAVIPWNAYQFCERLVQYVSNPETSDELSKAESPPNDFTSVCLGMFGNVCLKHCRTLANLYDEASRPGAGENGGLDGNNNVWDSSLNDQGRWDSSRHIPSAGKFSGESKDFGPTFVRNKRKLIYQITQSDCVKCIKRDDCVPDCLIDGDCSGENVEDLHIDEEMNGKAET